MTPVISDERLLEAARVVAGCVSAGIRGGESKAALLALGVDEFEPWELTVASLRLLHGLLVTVAREYGEDAESVAQRWALSLAST